MNELFESLSIDDKTKAELTEAFDKAVMAKSVELMESHVQEKIEEARVELEEEYKEKVEDLEETLDGYLTSVVEEFVAENEIKHERIIEEAKVEKLLEAFDTMLKVTGVEMLEIQEAKSEKEILEDENSLENKLARLEEKLTEKEHDLIEARKEAAEYLKTGIIAEISEGLTIAEKEKFETLAEMIEFSKDEKYVNALETIKENLIDNRAEGFNESTTGTKLPEAAYKSEEVDVKAAIDFSKYV